MAFSIQKKIHKKQCRDCINLGTLVQNNSVPSQSHHGVQESYYDYDIFGSPITGDYTTGTDYGYLGKPYDSITGLYNYGYRDYSPQTVRFTTVDPIRDGSNWFAYVNNDPVNYVDLWGLLASDGKIDWIKEVEMSGSQTAFDLLNTDYEFVSETTVNQDFTVTIPTKFGLSVDINFTELSDLIIKSETQLINKIKDKS